MPLDFEHIEWAILLLVLLPVISVWYWWEWRKKAIRKNLANNPRLLKTLLNNFRPKWAAIRLTTFSIALAGLCFALLNPRVIDRKAQVPMQGIQVMIVMDVSNSMLANDIAPNRLEKARMFAIRLAEKFSGSRIGLLAFAGEARLQMPPTSDLSAIRQALQTLDFSSVPLQGTNIEAALTETYNSLASDALLQKGVVLITDGEALEGNAAEVAGKFGKQGMVVHVVSVGTDEGGLLNDPETGLPIVDENDQQVVSRPDNKLLAEIAEATGGGFQRLENTDEAVSKVSGLLEALEKNPQPNGDLVNYYSYVPWILLVVLVFLTFEWWQPLFRKSIKPATLFLLLLFCTGIEANAQSVQSGLKNGLDAYKRGDYQAALNHFSEVLQVNPLQSDAKFYQALAQYRLKNFSQALSGFSEAAEIPADQKKQSAAWNNAALASIESKQVEQAVDLFKKALKMNPNDEEVRRNLQKALLDLKKQQKQDEEQKPKEEPPMDKEDANQKLQEVMEQERQAREKMKPQRSGASNRKNW